MSETDRLAPPQTLRRRIYEVIEGGRGEPGASKWFDTVIVMLIVLNVLAFCLETVPSIEAVGALAVRLRDLCGACLHRRVCLAHLDVRRGPVPVAA